MRTVDFEPFGKIPRLNRDIVITEKIDGTNAAIVITPYFEIDHFSYEVDGVLVTELHKPDEARLVGVGSKDGVVYAVFTQSRNRFITPKNDNYGFAGWVARNVDGLVQALGEGRHFGEWWGSGIQRGYGRTNGDKSFSLFNTKRWGTDDGALADLYAVPGLDVVPVLYEGPFSQDAINAEMTALRIGGSIAQPGFTKPEGIVVFHTASREPFKVTLEGDEAPKGAAGHALDEEVAA